MKKILNVSGVQKLSKQTQQKIKGAGYPRPYCGGPRTCCIQTSNGGVYCDWGYCNGSSCTFA